MDYNLAPEKKSLAVLMLAEGWSIRAIERVTGVHRDSIMPLGVRAGEACTGIMDERVRNLPRDDIQVDETWAFIALDRASKPIPTFVVGKRDSYHAKAFMADLAPRLRNRVQLSSDGMSAYLDAVERGLGPLRLTGHAKATRCFAWPHGGGSRTVLCGCRPRPHIAAVRRPGQHRCRQEGKKSGGDPRG